MLLFIQFFVSFETFTKNFALSFKTVKVIKNLVFNFLIFFFSSLKIGSKNECRFRGEPKGS